jgi:iron complex outermembrane recepter protein
MIRCKLICLAGVALAAEAVVTAHAQETAPAGTLEEVVVTAQKRLTRLQDTPMAISALSGDDLQKRHVSTLEDLASSLPGLDVSRTTSTTMLAIRGVGSIVSTVGTESRVATHLDGIYLGRPWEALNQLYDVERVEYLRGPQGTLYGRNATAGAINFITRDPSSTPEGYLTVGVGNYSSVQVEGAINAPLSETWSGRFAATYNTHEGYDRDITSGHRVNDLNAGGLRAAIKYDSDAFNFVLKGDYGKQDDDSGAFVYGGPAVPGATLTGLLFGGQAAERPDVATDEFAFPSTDRETYGATAQAQWLFGESDVTALVSYRQSDSLIVSDGDLSSAPLFRFEVGEKAEQYSGEFRFHRGTAQYDLLAGVYYLQEDMDGAIAFPMNLVVFGGPSAFAQGIFSGGNITTDAYAAFSQFRWIFTPQFYAEVGARYSYERKKIFEGSQFDLTRPYSPDNPVIFDVTSEDSESWTSFDPKLTLGYQPSDNVLAYATVARGFKSGGFNLGGLQAPFDPEEITNYEAGLKLSTDDRRLAMNLSAFYYDYSNLQAYKFEGILIAVTNAAKATLKGLEADVRWIPIDSLTLGAGVELLDAKYDEYTDTDPSRLALGPLDLSGNTLPQAPDYRARVDATYTWSFAGGELSARGEGAWIDRVYFSQFQQRVVSVPSSFELNGFLTYENGPWTAQIYGRNLTDHRKYVYVNISSELNGFPVLGMENMPRTFGVRLTRQW